jgi:hypothetical protein
MKIRFTKSPVGIGYAYGANTELNCPKPFAKEMIELGYAIELEDSAGGDLPDDFPARDVLIGLGVSLEEVKTLDTSEKLEALKGIGKKSAENILKYLTK